MIQRISSRRASRPARQQGFVLVTGLLFLVILTMLGLSLFRSTGLMDRISGNTRDKQRSFESAQSALSYGEWWINGSHGGVGTPCTGLVNGDPANVTNVHTCSNALVAGFQNTVPFPNAFIYTPPNMTIALTGGLVDSSKSDSDINYQALPGFYVEDLGLAPDGVSEVYQVTAYGKGGNADSASVVRSTYKVTPSVKPLTNL
jgi:type IV pilus assembly protein PilX